MDAETACAGRFVAAKGAALVVHFAAPAGVDKKFEKVTIHIHYELYDNLPVMVKWVEVINGGENGVVVTGLEGEILAVTEFEKNRLHVESNYAFDGMNTTCWGPDADYATQVDYTCQSPF